MKINTAPEILGMLFTLKYPSGSFEHYKDLQHAINHHLTSIEYFANRPLTFIFHEADRKGMIDYHKSILNLLNKYKTKG